MLRFIFLLLSLSIWSNKILENSNENLFVDSSEVFFVKKYTLNNFYTNNLIVTRFSCSPTNISNINVDSQQINHTEAKLKISNFNSDDIHIKPNTITVGLDQLYFEDTNQTEKHFTSNQFYNIQGDVFISSGTILYVDDDDDENILDLLELVQNCELEKLNIETKQKHTNLTTITNMLPLSGNSFFGLFAVKFTTVQNLKYKIKKLNSFYVVNHKQELLDFNYQKNYFLLIDKGISIPSSYCKYSFSLPPPTEIV